MTKIVMEEALLSLPIDGKGGHVNAIYKTEGAHLAIRVRVWCPRILSRFKGLSTAHSICIDIEVSNNLAADPRWKDVGALL